MAIYSPDDNPVDYSTEPDNLYVRPKLKGKLQVNIIGARNLKSKFYYTFKIPTKANNIEMDTFSQTDGFVVVKLLSKDSKLI